MGTYDAAKLFSYLYDILNCELKMTNIAKYKCLLNLHES